MKQAIPCVFGLLLASSAVGCTSVSPSLAGPEAALPCVEEFRRGSGVWTSRSFVDFDGVESTDFSPVTRLIVVDGVIHTETWGGEPKPAPVEVRAGRLEIAPRYLAALESDPPDSAGRAVAGYAAPGATHQLVLVGDCGRPERVEIIIARDGDVATVVFAGDGADAAEKASE